MQVASGEMCQNRIVFKQLIMREAIDVVQIDACRLGGVNEALAVMLMAAIVNGLMVCPHAGGVGLCEYVQHLSMIDCLCIAGTKEGPCDRVRRSPARALRRSLRDPRCRLHAAEAPGLFDRDETRVAGRVHAHGLSPGRDTMAGFFRVVTHLELALP